VNTARLEVLVDKVRALPDGEARDTALELVQAVMELHATGLESLMEVLAESDNNGNLFDRLAGSPEVSCILLLHGVHPLHIDERVRRALIYVRGQGATAELVSVRDGVVRVRIEGDEAFKASVQAAVAEAAPDAVAIEISGGEGRNGFIPLTALTGTAL
jgi:hypothetical protein